MSLPISSLVDNATFLQAIMEVRESGLDSGAVFSVQLLLSVLQWCNRQQVTLVQFVTVADVIAFAKQSCGGGSLRCA